MSDFIFDLGAQKPIRDLVLAPGYYGPYSFEGRFVTIDKGRLSEILQKRYAVDTVVQSKNGQAVFIEEKIIRHPGYDYKRFALETDSCTVPGRESEGWMHYGQADYLLEAMCRADGDVEVYLIDFPKLREAFWPAVDTFSETITEQLNKTKCRLVPIAWVRDNAPTSYRHIYADDEGRAAVIAYNKTHYKHKGTRAE